GQRVDVERTPGEQRGDAGEHPGLVLHQYGEGVSGHRLDPLLVAFERRADAAGVLDVVVAHTGGDHRPHHRIGTDHEVHHHRAVVDLLGLADGRIDVGDLLAAQAHAPVCLRQLYEVRDAGTLVTGVQVGVGVALVVEQRLPLPHHAQGGVVDDRDLDRDPLQGAGGQLLVGHLEAAVAVDRPHRGVRTAHLGAHRRRHRVAHRAQTAVVQPYARLLVADVQLI